MSIYSRFGFLRFFFSSLFFFRLVFFFFVSYIYFFNSFRFLVVSVFVPFFCCVFVFRLHFFVVFWFHFGFLFFCFFVFVSFSRGKIKGGITNVIFKAKSAATGEGALIRVYGKDTDLLLDRR